MENMRYMVKITPYKNMFKFDYIDKRFDASHYCFFTYENGYEKTNYSGISERLFNKLFNSDMKPGKVYGLETESTWSDTVVSFSEIPSHWYHI